MGKYFVYAMFFAGCLLMSNLCSAGEDYFTSVTGCRLGETATSDMEPYTLPAKWRPFTRRLLTVRGKSREIVKIEATCLIPDRAEAIKIFRKIFRQINVSKPVLFKAQDTPTTLENLWGGQLDDKEYKDFLADRRKMEKDGYLHDSIKTEILSEDADAIVIILKKNIKEKTQVERTLVLSMSQVKTDADVRDLYKDCEGYLISLSLQ